MKSLLFLLALTFSAVAALYQVDGAPWSTSPSAMRAADAADGARPGGAPPLPAGGGAPVSDPSAVLAPETVQALQSEILSRPLFARTRKPGDDKPAQAVPGADAVFAGQQARLLGVYLAPPVKRALVRFADAEPEWLNEGATSRGWTVKAVSARDAVIVGATGEMTLDLHAPQP